jgi:DNA replication licensing factor MCM2
MRISEAFCKMRLSDYCSSIDVDRAIAVAVDSFVGSQKVSAKKALAKSFAKYTLNSPGAVRAPARAGRQAQRTAA